MDRKTDLSWLGAEALPGDLAAINRVYDTRHDAAARYRTARPLKSRGIIAAARHWLKSLSPSGW